MRLLSRWVLVGLVAEGVLAFVDALVHGASILTTSFIVPVLVVALVETAPRTAVVALLGILLAVLSGTWHHDEFSGAHFYRLGIVAGGSLVAAIGAGVRARAVTVRDRMEMLAAIAEIGDGGADLEQALHRLSDILVPGAADACTLTVFDGPRARRLLIKTADPRITEVLDARTSPPRQALATARTGETVLVQRFPSPVGRHRTPVSEEAREIMARAHLSSVIYAPLRTGDVSIALLLLGVGPSGRRYGPDDIHFARTVASRAGLAIENARLLDELHSARQRLEATVGSLADAVTIREPGGRLIYANDAAKRSMGLSPEHDITREDPADLLDRYLVYDEAGRPLNLDDLPSVRLLAGKTPEALVLRFVSRAGGDERWCVLKSSPLYDPQGRLEAAVTVIEDITLPKRSELRSGFLSRASEILASSLDYEQTLRNVAELAVPDLADWCAVDLIDDDGPRRHVVAAHRDPAKVALVQRLREMSRRDIDPKVGLGAAVRTGRPQLVASIDDDLLRRAATGPEHLSLLREVGMRSALVVPMAGATGVIGAMTLVNAESGRRFGSDDVGFAQELAGRAAVAVENAHLYSERTRIADTLQRSLLPEVLPDIDGWDIAGLYRPAAQEIAVEVGGDFYDAFPVPGGWIVLIGDVTGKGVEAAAMTSLVRHGARFVAEHVDGPADVLARLDRALREQASLSLCTALCLRLEPGRVTLASAGHPLPYVIGEGGVRAAGRPGPVLGAFPDSTWPTEELRLRAGEVIVLYTDGVTDTVGRDGRFGEEGLAAALARCEGRSSAEVLRRLDEALSDFQAGAQADDTAAIALRRATRGAALLD